MKTEITTVEFKLCVLKSYHYFVKTLKEKLEKQFYLPEKINLLVLILPKLLWSFYAF